MNKNARILITLILSTFTFGARAATDWSTQDYDLYPGDFDGDGKTDLLYVAKDPAKASGIAKSDGSAPNIPFQSWPSNYLGLPWHGNLYSVHVADFNGDQRADIFLQRNSAGNSYLLLGNVNGKITGTHQEIGHSYLGVYWSSDQHKIVTGDFSGDGKADLFLQATSASGTHAVFVADGNGQFTTSPQTWTDASWGAFKWSTASSNIFAGDFNGDGKADLLIQAKPKIILIDYDIPIPVPTYQPNTFGVVLSQGGGTPMAQTGVQQWSRTSHGVDWSPNAANIIVGNFDGSGGADVLLQARNSSRPSYLLNGNTSGAVFTAATSVSANVTITGDSARLLAGNFDGGSAVGIYVQATTPGGNNYYANAVGSSISASYHNPAAPTGSIPATTVGASAGNYSVSITGKAVYNIPIAVPPGTNGMTPQIAIDYDSSRGNGLLGVGWGISGLSVITRCNKTLAQDGIVASPGPSSSDVFCLDGNRLRLQSGSPYGGPSTVYRTERETFSRITANGTSTSPDIGPSWFRVEGRDGLYYEYGNSSSSRFGPIWALSRVSDRDGNETLYTYESDYIVLQYYTKRVGLRPTEILYRPATGSPQIRVRFSYESRPDVVPGYLAAANLLQQKRLDRIDIELNSTLVRRYELSYQSMTATGRSRLSSVQECTASDCLPPTNIFWSQDTAGLSAEAVTAVTLTDLKYSLSGDMDGDGRDDLAFFQASTDSWQILRGTATGFGAPVDTGFGSGAYQQQALMGDIDGDGKLDLLVPDLSSGQVRWWWLRQNSAGTWIYTNTNIPADGANGDAWLMDVNGDGLDDLFWKSSATEIRWRDAVVGTSQLAMTGSFAVAAYGSNPYAIRPTIQIADLNADGAKDVVFRQQDGAIDTRLGSTAGLVFHSVDQDQTIYTGVQIGNLNGDRYPDYYYTHFYTNPAGTYGWTLRLNDGRTDFAPPLTVTSVSSNAQETLTFDWDGDGRDDLLNRNTTTGQWDYLRSTGEEGLLAAQSTGIAATGATLSPKVMDINGDGLPDLVYIGSGNSVRYRLHAGPKPDRLSSIVDGLGNSVAFNLQSLASASGCYQRDAAPSVSTHRIYTGTMYVTCSLTASDGTGGMATTTYSYYNANSDRLGRGFLGFERRYATDTRTGLTVRETFNQVFPYIGLVASAVTVQSNPAYTVLEQSYTYASHPYGSGEAARQFPYVSASLAKRYEVGGPSNGTWISSTAVTNTVNTWGVLADQATTTTEVATGIHTNATYTRRTYHPQIFNDESNWCLGKPQETQQINSHSLTWGASTTRTLSRVWDGAKCRIMQEVIEPSSADLKVTTDYLYDSFGNVRQITVTPVGQSPRVTMPTWTTDGRFLYSLKNALNQTSYFDWDAALGTRKSFTDPNGLQTQWFYDGFSRLTEERRPDGTSTTIGYAACSAGCGLAPAGRTELTVRDKNTLSGAIFAERKIALDAFGRPRLAQSYQLDGRLSQILTDYHANGQVARESMPHFSGTVPEWTSFGYDTLDRVTSISRAHTSDADSSAWSTTLAYEGLRITQTDAAGKQTSRIHDAVGRIVRAVDAASNATSYAYDAFGNLKTTTDVQGNQIELGYNVRGMKTSSNDPDLGAWQYEYFPLGELKKQTDAKGQIVEFTYDALGRPYTRTEPEGVTTFTWGSSAAAKNIGSLYNVLAAGDPGTTADDYFETYTYDAVGRVAGLSTLIDGTTYDTSYAYSAVHGKLASITYPQSTGSTPFKAKYEYAYDLDNGNRSGQLKRVSDYDVPATVFWTATGTNAAGQVSNEALGNGLVTERGYDSITGVINTIRTGIGGGASVQQLNYVWDKVGNLTQRKDVNQNVWEDVTYDNLYRIDTVARNGAQTLNVDYDVLGNITKKSDVSASSWTYHATRKHAVVTAGANTYTYDANGNMAARNGATTTWFSFNLPDRIDHTGGNYSQFSYGAARQRIKQVSVAGAQTETTIYVGGLYEKLSRATGTEYKHYIVTDGGAVAVLNRKSGGTTEISYLLKDHLGSTDKITSSSGSVLASLSYDVFGKRRGSNWQGAPAIPDLTTIGNTTRDGFTGHEHLDNLTLVHMNGRVYDPDIGRFTSADPFVQAPFDLQSLNRYSYVFNNPLKFTDPSGFEGDDQTTGSGLEYLYQPYGPYGPNESLGPRGGVRTPVKVPTRQEQWDSESVEAEAESAVGGSWSAWSLIGITSADAADAPTLFDRMWSGYPSKKPYVDPKTGRPPKGFEDQCAIQLSVAFHGAGIDMRSFKGAGVIRLNGKRTAIRAQEFADWLKSNSIPGVGRAEVITGADWADRIDGRKGVVFFADYWFRANGQRTGDHIDLWNGSRMTARSTWFRVHWGISYDGYWSDYNQATTIIFWPVE